MLVFYSHQFMETSPFSSVDVTEPTPFDDHMLSGAENKNNYQAMATCSKNSGLALMETKLDLNVNGRDKVHTTGINAITGNFDELPGAHKMQLYTSHALQCTQMPTFPVLYTSLYMCRLETIRPIACCNNNPSSKIRI